MPFVENLKVSYPSIPDQWMNHVLNQLLDLSHIGISLTENGMMVPTAAVSGLYIAHSESYYFMIGTIDEEQLADYAERRQLPADTLRKVLSRHVE